MKMDFGLQNMFYKYHYGHNQRTEGIKATQVKHMDIVCLRRDSAALQAVISDENDFLLSVSRDALFWKGGPLNIARVELEWSDNTAASIQADVKLIGLVEDDDRLQKSDILLEEQSIFVEKGRIQQVWIELHAGEETLPGKYSGKLMLYLHSMFEDERVLGEVSFTWTVLEDILPAPQDYRFYLDLWQHNCNIARKHQAQPWSDAHFQIMGNYLESMSELGQKALSLIVSEAVWSGQHTHRDREPSDLFEYSIVPINKDRNNIFTYDFSLMDRYIELGFSFGIDKEIELFGLISIWQDPSVGYGAIVEGYPDAIRVRYYDESDKVFRFMRSRNELESYVRAIEQHLIHKGWIERVRIIADEPADLEQFTKSMEALRQIAPSFKFKAAILHSEFIKQKIEGMSDYVPILGCAAGEFTQLIEMRPHIPGKLLYYTCCGPDYPNTFLQSPATESRMMAWVAEKLQLDGYLRWNYTVWPDHPLEKLTYRSPYWKAGDMNFVYPSSSGKPQLSLRYKWLQRGIRDYEFMQILKGRGENERVLEALKRVFYFDDPKELLMDSGKAPAQLYSMNNADFELLYANGNLE
jgi:hypothetical protein